MKTKLGVNIDHIATIREARKTYEPDPALAVGICELAGASCITAHLREDRRHINDRDVKIIKQVTHTKFNLEMSCAEEIVKIALDINPDQVTLVPEKRNEVTTEGGLDVVRDAKKIKDIVEQFKAKNIVVSLFVDPKNDQIDASVFTGADFIELHTGTYSFAKSDKAHAEELQRIVLASKYASEKGLRVNAGHGLNYFNVQDISSISEIEELNIGHAIISRAVFVGLENAVYQMVNLVENSL